MENIVVSTPTENCLNCGIRFSPETPVSESNHASGDPGGTESSRSRGACKIRGFTSNLGRRWDVVDIQVKDAIEEIFTFLELTDFSSAEVDCGVCENCCMLLATIYDLVVMLKSRRARGTPEPFLWTIVDAFKSNLVELANKLTSGSSPINVEKEFGRSTKDDGAKYEDSDSDCIFIEEDDDDVILLDEPVESSMMDEGVVTAMTSSGQNRCTSCVGSSPENGVTESKLQAVYQDLEKIRKDGLRECRVCQKLLMTKWSFRRHIRSIHLKLRAKCKHCGVHHTEANIKRHTDACSKKLKS